MISKGVLLIISLLGFCHIVDSACTFPSELQNVEWISSLTNSTTSSYSTLTFTTSNLTIDFYLSYSKFYCFITDGGNKYVLQSNLIINPTFGNYYSYLCLDFRRQNAYSYAFYVLSHTSGLSEYYHKFAPNYAASIDNVCDQTKGDGEYYVLIRKNFETSAQQTCVTPLLGVFYYSQRYSGTTCTSGKWDICNSNSTQIAVSTTSSSLCSTANAGNLDTGTGYILCVASVFGTYYYQTTYFASMKRFVCMTVGYSGTNVSITQSLKLCEYTQTPTNVSTSGSYFTLVVNETCVPVSAQSSSGKTNVGLIVGVVVGVVVLLAIVCGVLWYKLYWVKKKKASITKITENRREKFQDPYLEEKDKKSTVTREDVVFDIDDVDRITPTAPNITIEGDAQDSTTKVANGHAVTQRNGHVPNNRNNMEGPASVSPYIDDPAPMEDDSSSVNKRPGKFKSLDLDEESSPQLRTINEVEDEDKPPVTTTTKTTNISITEPSVHELLTPVSGEI